MKNVENKLKYDYVWITRMLSEDFAEMEPFDFKKRIKEADNEHLKFLLKSLQLREEFLGCYFVSKKLKTRKRIYNRKTIILNKKWNTSFTTKQI